MQFILELIKLKIQELAISLKKGRQTKWKEYSNLEDKEDIFAISNGYVLGEIQPKRKYFSYFENKDTLESQKRSYSKQKSQNEEIEGNLE